jgi:hypothetical protein
MDARRKRLVALRIQLESLYVIGRTTAPGSPERQAVLEQLEPVLASVHALNNELVLTSILVQVP